MQQLFNDEEIGGVEHKLPPDAPLATRVRPRTLDEFVGQERLLAAGSALRRAIEDLMGLKNIVVLSDAAHHCYREKPQAEDGTKLKGEEKEEAKKNNEAARLWISGIETLKRNLGIAAVYDMSATPFFLRGSGYPEGTLFP